MMWINGTMVSGELNRIHLGHGVFETLRTHPDGIWQEARHRARLERGAKVLGLEIPESLDDCLNALAKPDHRIRIDLHGGPLLDVGGPGAATLQGTSRPFVPDEDPVHVVTTAIECPVQPWSGIKTTSMFAHVQARRAHPEGDALLVHGGAVVEASTANVFALLDGAWVSPGPASGAVDGVTRQVLLDAIRADERIPLSDLERVDALALTNTAGIRPVLSLDGRALDVTPIQELQDVFEEAWQCR